MHVMSVYTRLGTFQGSQNDSFQSFFFWRQRNLLPFILCEEIWEIWMQIPSGFIYAEEAKPSINQDSCQDSSYGECSSSTY